MIKIVRFLCAAGLLATMLGSSTLWSQGAGGVSESQTEEAVEQEAPKQKAPKQRTGADESPNNKKSAAASEKKTAGDFKPSEEISEDFPVPLPSDI